MPVRCHGHLENKKILLAHYYHVLLKKYLSFKVIWYSSLQLMSLIFSIHQSWASAKVNESKLSEIRKDQTNESCTCLNHFFSAWKWNPIHSDSTLHCSTGTDQPSHLHWGAPFGHFFRRRPQHHPWYLSAGSVTKPRPPCFTASYITPHIT